MGVHAANHPLENDSGRSVHCKLRSLETAARQLACTGGSVPDVLDLLISGVADAVPALSHALAIQLPNGSTHLRSRGDREAAARALTRGGSYAGERTFDYGRDLLAFPVASGSHDYGTLVAVAPPGSPFSPEDRSVLAACSHHAAAGIELSVLRNELQAQRETGDMLLEAARSLSEHHTLEEVALSMSEAALLLSGADRSVVALWNSDAAHLSFHGALGWRGPGTRTVPGIVLTAEECPELREMLLNPAPLLLDSRSSDWAQSMLDHFHLHALLAVPILTGGEFRGLVATHWDTNPPRSLDHPAVHNLSRLSGLASVALRNAQLLEDAHWMATHDPLTGLANAMLFEESLYGSLEKAMATGDQVGVLLFDINRFKRVNDSLGHSAGDEVLRQIATRLRNVVNHGETVARINGDRFAVFVRGAGAADRARTITAATRHASTEPLIVHGEKLFIDMAMGSATTTVPSSGKGDGVVELAQKLIELADLDLSRSKARLSHIMRSDPADAERLRLENDLRGASDRGELFVHYQPQIDLASGSIVGVEALVRWEHPELGMISPASFIPIAEESGLILDVGAYVLKEATRTGASWHTAGFRVEMAVNVSVVQLSAPDFLSQIKETLSQTGFPATSLTVEVTESQVVVDHSALAIVLHELRALGVCLSIDDFGTGFSSLAQLQRMPVTEVKIDRSFTSELTSSEISPFIAGIVGLSHGLSLRVIAEGVETEDQLAAVRAAGCDRAQGYLLARPGDAATVFRLIKDD